MIIYAQSFEYLVKKREKMKKIFFTILATIIIPFSLAHAKTVEHEFTAILGIFNASDTNFTYTLTPQNYAIYSQVNTAGIFDSIYPFQAIYSTTGKIKNNELETRSYKYKSKSLFNKRTRELVYDKSGKPLYRLSTKNNTVKKVEIEPDESHKNTTDLQTVFAKLAKQYTELKFCNSRMEVFDGKKRFSVIFKDEGQETLHSNEYSPFAGKATKCSMYIDKLNSKDDDLMWKLTSKHPVYFWIMEDKESKMPFIAHILVEDTPLGRLDVYTKNITVKDK